MITEIELDDGGRLTAGEDVQLEREPYWYSFKSHAKFEIKSPCKVVAIRQFLNNELVAFRSLRAHDVSISMGAGAVLTVGWSLEILVDKDGVLLNA